MNQGDGLGKEILKNKDYTTDVEPLIIPIDKEDIEDYIPTILKSNKEFNGAKSKSSVPNRLNQGAVDFSLEDYENSSGISSMIVFPGYKVTASITALTNNIERIRISNKLYNVPYTIKYHDDKYVKIYHLVIDPNKIIQEPRNVDQINQNLPEGSTSTHDLTNKLTNSKVDILNLIEVSSRTGQSADSYNSTCIEDGEKPPFNPHYRRWKASNFPENDFTINIDKLDDINLINECLRSPLINYLQHQHYFSMKPFDLHFHKIAILDGPLIINMADDSLDYYANTITGSNTINPTSIDTNDTGDVNDWIKEDDKNKSLENLNDLTTPRLGFGAVKSKIEKLLNRDPTSWNTKTYDYPTCDDTIRQEASVIKDYKSVNDNGKIQKSGLSTGKLSHHIIEAPDNTKDRITEFTVESQWNKYMQENESPILGPETTPDYIKRHPYSMWYKILDGVEIDAIYKKNTFDHFINDSHINSIDTATTLNELTRERIQKFKEKIRLKCKTIADEGIGILPIPIIDNTDPDTETPYKNLVQSFDKNITQLKLQYSNPLIDYTGDNFNYKIRSSAIPSASVISSGSTVLNPELIFKPAYYNWLYIHEPDNFVMWKKITITFKEEHKCIETSTTNPRIESFTSIIDPYKIPSDVSRIGCPSHNILKRAVTTQLGVRSGAATQSMVDASNTLAVQNAATAPECPASSTSNYCTEIIENDQFLINSMKNPSWNNLSYDQKKLFVQAIKEHIQINPFGTAGFGTHIFVNTHSHNYEIQCLSEDETTTPPLIQFGIISKTPLVCSNFKIGYGILHPKLYDGKPEIKFSYNAFYSNSKLILNKTDPSITQPAMNYNIDNPDKPGQIGFNFLIIESQVNSPFTITNIEIEVVPLYYKLQLTTNKLIFKNISGGGEIDCSVNNIIRRIESNIVLKKRDKTDSYNSIILEQLIYISNDFTIEIEIQNIILDKPIITLIQTKDNGQLLSIRKNSNENNIYYLYLYDIPVHTIYSNKLINYTKLNKLNITLSRVDDKYTIQDHEHIIDSKQWITEISNVSKDVNSFAINSILGDVSIINKFIINATPNQKSL